LFESFVIVNGKRTSRRAMVTLSKLCNVEKRQCTDAEVSGIVNDERVGFYANIMCSLSNRGRGANRQLFFFTLLAQAWGLSRTGMEFFNSFNVVLAPRSFDQELTTFCSTVIERERFAACAESRLLIC